MSTVRMGSCLLSMAALLFTPALTISAQDKPLGPERIRQGAVAGLRVIEKSAAAYPNQRTCFSCHHQTLPMQAMVVARQHGFTINDALLQSQTKLTRDSFKARVMNLKEGTGIGGRSMTVGFGLWALNLGGGKTDETTSAMISFLLKDQEADGHFSSNLSRPPLEDSIVTSTTIAAYYMQKFVTAEKKGEVERSVQIAREWLIQAQPKSQEDRNSKLWGLHLLGAGRPDMEKAHEAVLQNQRTDGGWSQLPLMESDAYATGQTLFVLQESGLSASTPAYQRGLQFLLNTQLTDGSWQVKTRSKPVQTYYESDFPHGKDQFISISATSWAVAALAANCLPSTPN